MTGGHGAREEPACDPDQVRVMVLGTYHMDSPGLDERNLDVDDVLAGRRQAELRDLADRLAAWGPDRVAVERPHDREGEVNARFEEYRSGERAYEREERFPSPHPERNETDTECRSEVVQVGFRLADRLGHDRVACVDEHPGESRYDPAPFEGRDVDSGRKTGVEPPELDAEVREEEARLARSTVAEFHAWLNAEGNHRFNHDAMFDRAVRAAGGSFGSPVALTAWYDRNLRIVHHLWRSMDERDERVLFLVGAGHVRVLRHLLTEAPMFCPVSPLPVLPSVGGAE